MKIYLATNNQHKKREMAEIFSDHEIVTPSDEGIEFAPEETGATFYENSVIKARTLYQIVRAPVIADDSGICVDALGGRPGIFSARYGGKDNPCGSKGTEKITQELQNKFLVEELNEVLAQKNEKNACASALAGAAYLPEFKNGPRSCHYTCAMTLYLGQDRIFVATETMEGSLIENIDKARGKGGFGYDPLVILPNGKTVAELSESEKNEISHRGKACQAILRLLESMAVGK